MFLRASVLLLLLLNEGWALKDVQLTIRPQVVERHQRSVLHCDYDLEGGQLYTVKWYRGQHEFYRYTATETPHTKVFPYAGITVDVNHSNSTQVQLENIEFNLSGNFSCEVTTDNPMLVGTDVKSMLVVLNLVEINLNCVRTGTDRRSFNVGKQLKYNRSIQRNVYCYYANDIPTNVDVNIK